MIFCIWDYRSESFFGPQLRNDAEIRRPLKQLFISKQISFLAPRLLLAPCFFHRHAGLRRWNHRS